MNISTILDMAAEVFGERPAVISGDLRPSYAELRRKACAAARAVRQQTYA